MAPREVPQVLTQGGFSGIGGRLDTTLGQTVLAHRRARPDAQTPRTPPGAAQQPRGGGRGSHFGSASSLSIA